MTNPIVVGLSYRTAPMGLLERAALGAEAARELEQRLSADEHVTEAVVLSTCNRLEVYASVSRFHGGLATIGQLLAESTGVAREQLNDHLYVHYEAAAVCHLFSVASGLDSMAVGEQQILGQVRTALRAAQDGGTAARTLVPLLQQALRVGKRAHAETGLDGAGLSLVEAALGEAVGELGPLPGLRALVLGAGAMSGLAVATLTRAGVGALTVVNRTAARAQRLAESARAAGLDDVRSRPMTELAEALAEADVVLACAGAMGHLIEPMAAKAALAARDGRPQVYLDLALPRDIDPQVAELDGARVVDLEGLGRILAEQPIGAELAAARRLVADEVEVYRSMLTVQQIAPTVVALRGMAAGVVEAEVERLRARLGDGVEAKVLTELEQTVHRVVDKLLHTPTVRVKELAGEPNGTAYADALRALFDLDPGRVDAVISPVGSGVVDRVGYVTGGAS